MRWIALGAAVLAWLAICARERRRVFEHTPLNLPIALFTLLAVASLIYTVDRGGTLTSLAGSHARTLAVFFLVAGALGAEARSRRLVIVCACAFLVTCAVAAINALLGNLNTTGGLVAFGNKNSTTMGKILGAFFPFLLIALGWPRRVMLRVISLILAFLGLVAVSLTYSRTAAVGAVGTCAVWAVLHGGRRLAVALAAFLVVFALVAPSPLVKRFATIRSQIGTLSDRLVVWRFDLGEVKKRPLLGWGYGTEIHQLLYRAADRADRQERLALERRGGHDANAVDEHSSFVAALLQMGIVGLALYVWILGGAIFLGARCLRALPPGRDRDILIGALAGLVGEYVVHALADRNNIGRWAIPLWAYIGLVMAIVNRHTRSRLPSCGGPEDPARMSLEPAKRSLIP